MEKEQIARALMAMTEAEAAALAMLEIIERAREAMRDAIDGA